VTLNSGVTHPNALLCTSKSSLEPLGRRKERTLKRQIPLVLSALAPQTHSQKTAKQPLYQTPGCLSLKMRCIYNIQILGSSVSELYVRGTYAKYAILAKMYNVAVIPSPSGPAILRVRTGFLTSLRT
jgi:hypothetical protein